MNPELIKELLFGLLNGVIQALMKLGATLEEIAEASKSEVLRIKAAEDKASKEEWDTVRGMKTQDMP